MLVEMPAQPLFNSFSSESIGITARTVLENIASPKHKPESFFFRVYVFKEVNSGLLTPYPL